MATAGRREINLLVGLMVLVAMAVVLVFVYTQAARRLEYQRRTYLAFKEQLARCKLQIQSEGSPDPAPFKAKLAELEGRLLAQEALEEFGQAFGRWATERFGFQDPKVKVGEHPDRSIEVPVEPKSPLTLDLFPMELKASATAKAACEFLAALARPEVSWLIPVEAMTFTALPAHPTKPVEVTLKCLAATAPTASDKRDFLKSLNELPKPKVTWGLREEPFVSPLSMPSAYRIPKEKLERFKLTGILWNPADPSCVINERVLRPGDALGVYRLVLITPTAVILQGPDEEILLHLP